MTRQTKTPRQRAEEQLAVANRAVKRLEQQRAHHQGELNKVVGQLEDAVRRRDYLAKHPDLPQEAERQLTAARHNRSNTPTGATA